MNHRVICEKSELLRFRTYSPEFFTYFYTEGGYFNSAKFHEEAPGVMKWLYDLERIERNEQVDAATYTTPRSDDEVSKFPRWVKQKFENVCAALGKKVDFMKSREWTTFAEI